MIPFYGIQEVLQCRDSADIWAVRSKQRVIAPERSTRVSPTGKPLARKTDPPKWYSPVTYDYWFETEEDAQGHCDRVMALYREIKQWPVKFRGWTEAGENGAVHYLRAEAT